MVRTPDVAQRVYYYHYDGLGSVAALSYFTGSLIEKYTYDVYGKPTIKSSTGDILSKSAYNNPYMFTGREYDPCVGIYYYRARYYNPTIGRFMQTDPIGYEGGLNLYAYVNNTPVNWIDPYGLYSSTDQCMDECDKVKGSAEFLNSCYTCCSSCPKCKTPAPCDEKSAKKRALECIMRSLPKIAKPPGPSVPRTPG